MSNKLLSIDIDGTLANFLDKAIQQSFIDKIDIQYPLKLGKSHPNFAEADNYIHTIASNPEIYRDLEVIKDAVYGVKALSEYFNIVYLTHRPIDSFDITKEWLNKNGFPSFPVEYSARKSDFCSLNDVFLHIDDRPEIAEEVMKNSNTKVYLLEQWWNNWYVPIAGIKKIHCWNDIVFFLYFYRDK